MTKTIKSKTLIKYILLCLVCFGIMGLVYYKLKSNQKEAQEKVYKKDININSTVQTETVKIENFNQSNTYLGTFSPSREVVIGSQVAGKVIQVGVNEGSYVTAGSVIAELENDILKSQLNTALINEKNAENILNGTNQATYDNAIATVKGSAQANYDNAVSTLNRYEQAGTGISQLQLDNARTQVAVAKSQLDNAKTQVLVNKSQLESSRSQILVGKSQIEQINKQLKQYTIVAPFSGTITSRNFDLGAVVSPGQQLATITNISSLKLEITVPEKDINLFRIGKPVSVKTEIYPDQFFTGNVNYISIKADAAHNFIVKILVDNNATSPIKAGMYGSVKLINEIANSSKSIPRSALIGSSIHPQVYVVENGIAKLRNIEIGAANEDRLQVTNGLEYNEIVVIGGLVNLTDGVKVNITK